LGKLITIGFIAGAIYLILLIVSGALKALDIWLMNLSFFVQDNWFLWIAILCAVLAAILFYASSKSYKDVKFKESFLPNLKKSESQNIVKGDLSVSKYTESENDIRELDLSKLTMEALVKRMAFELTKPGPVFFKGWSNRRLELDVERTQILKNYIDSIISTGESLMDLQSDAVLSFEKIEALTYIKQNELKARVRQSEKELDFVNEKYKHELEMMRLDREEREENIKLIRVQREGVEVDNTIRKLKAEAEYKLMLTKGTKEEQIALMMAQAVKYFKDLPNILKSYVIVQLGTNNNQAPEADMELQDKLKEFIIRKHEAETKKIEYEAEEDQAEKETHILKLEREKKKYSGDGSL